MRAYHWVGVLAVSVLSGCGGESELNEKPPGSQEPEGGSGNEAGAGELGEAGEPGVAGAASGGVSSGGAGNEPGTAGSMSRPPSTGTGGAVGTPGKPPIGMPGFPGIPGGGSTGLPETPAEGCEPASQSTGPGYCQIVRQCENTQVYAYCNDQGGGVSSCTCQHGNGVASFAIQGSGLAACESIADLCSAGGQPKVTGEVKCAPLYSSKAADACELQEQCTQAIEGDDSISVITGSSFVYCYSDGAGGQYCQCSDNKSGGREYRLSGTSGKDSCDLVRGFCSAEPPEFGEKTCTPNGQSSGSGYCSLSSECRETADVGGGVSAVRYEYRFANCQSSSGGVATCSCGSNQGGVQFDYIGTVSADTCNTAAEVCGDPEAFELTGSIECSRAAQNANRDYCSSSFQCSQSGKLGMLDIKAYGYLQTECGPSGDGETWSCSCYSGNGTSSASTTVESSGDAWADCTAASDKCQELVEVQIGSGGGLIGRPIPLAF